VFDARENLRSAIPRNRVRVEEINLILNRSVPTTSSNRGRSRLIEEKLHLEQCIAELQVELRSKDCHEAERSFRWEDLDPRLVSSKTMDIVEEMIERVKAAEHQISRETAKSGNSSGYVTRLLDFHEELTNEWAERLFAAYCEAWQEQNRSIIPAFIRAVRDHPIATLFAARKSSVAAEIGSRAHRTCEPMNPGSLVNWNLRMDRLAARWGRRLEAEAAKCEYRVARTQQPEGRDPVAAPSQLAGTPASQGHQQYLLFQCFRTRRLRGLAEVQGLARISWISREACGETRGSTITATYLPHNWSRLVRSSMQGITFLPPNTSRASLLEI
jgi:hypothetical protein